MRPIQVLFVCLGNICRSPMAEAVFRREVELAALAESIQIDSAGTGSWHVGSPPHSGTVTILRSHGLATHHTARQLSSADLLDMDYIVAMDATNLTDIRSFGKPRGKLARLLDYVPDKLDLDVPDPYYDGRFAHVYDLVDAGCRSLLRAICKEQGWRAPFSE